MNSGNDETKEALPVTENTESKKMAFSEFVKQGGSYRCEVSQSMSDFENNGVVYMDGADMRGEFSTVAEGMEVDSYFIWKDGYMYSWSSTLPTVGFKMKVDPTLSRDGAGADTSGTYAWNSEEVGEYNCEPWTRDEAVFTLPEGTTFREMTK